MISLPRSRWLALPLLLLIAPACGGGEGGDGEGKGGKGVGEEAEEQETPDRRVLVETAVVERGDVADHLVTTGSLESEAQADIVPEATGVVTKLLVEEGDEVSKGQLLAVLSNPSLEAGAERASVEVSRARREAETARSLHARGAISDQELRTAEEALTTAEASFSEAASTKGFTRITSPIAGVVSVRDLRVGELAGGQRAFQVVDLDRLRVIVNLPEKDLPRIRAGQPVVLQGAYDEAEAGQGAVRRVSPVVDTQTGTVRVTIDVDASSTSLRPGQFVKARIEVDRHENVLTIPRRALTWVDGEPVAWRVVDSKPDEPEEETAEGEGEEAEEAEEAGFFAKLFADEEAEGEGEEEAKQDEPPPWPLREAQRADLEIAFSDPSLVEVTAGLDEGDLVVTIGNSNLRGGTPIRLPEDPGPEAARKQAEEEEGEGKADADGEEAGAEG